MARPTFSVLLGGRCLIWFDPLRIGMALVAVELVAAQLCLFLKCQLGQGLPGALSEWLLALWASMPCNLTLTGS